MLIKSNKIQRRVELGGHVAEHEELVQRVGVIEVGPRRLAATAGRQPVLLGIVAHLNGLRAVPANKIFWRLSVLLKKRESF